MLILTYNLRNYFSHGICMIAAHNDHYITLCKSTEKVPHKVRLTGNQYGSLPFRIIKKYIFKNEPFHIDAIGTSKLFHINNCKNPNEESHIYFILNRRIQRYMRLVHVSISYK